MAWMRTSRDSARSLPSNETTMIEAYSLSQSIFTSANWRGLQSRYIGIGASAGSARPRKPAAAWLRRVLTVTIPRP